MRDKRPFPSSGSQPWRKSRISGGELGHKGSQGWRPRTGAPSCVQSGSIALHRRYIFTNWEQDLPPERKIMMCFITMLTVSSWSGSKLAVSLRYAMLLFHESDSDALCGLRATRARIGNWKPVDHIRPDPCWSLIRTRRCSPVLGAAPGTQQRRWRLVTRRYPPGSLK